MKEHINLLSKAELMRGLSHKTGVYNNRHVLFWDYDEHSLPLSLHDLVEEFNLDLHVIKTLNGFHLVDFGLFDVFEIEKIQKSLNKIIPSTYPTILKVKDLDTSDNQTFEGQTLRITRKGTESEDLIYFTNIRASNLSEKRFFSSGHAYIYCLVVNSKIDIIGTPFKTRINVCSFLNKKEQELIIN